MDRITKTHEIICGKGLPCEASCPIKRVGRVCPSLVVFASIYVANSSLPEGWEVVSTVLGA